MLSSLYIENFAIIDKLQIDLAYGMTVLTGETGAGKSIIIDAIGQLLGNRSQTSFIKKGKNKALIEGVFNISQKDYFQKKFSEFDIEIEDEIVVSKTISKDGKTTVKINYRPVSQTLVKQLIPLMIDIHSQFDTHLLFNQKNHLLILDEYIGQKVNKLKNEYQNLFQQYHLYEKQYNQLLNEELSDEQLDFYISQVKEIDEIDLLHLDEDLLIEERKKMQNYEKTSHHIQAYKDIMEGYQGVLTHLKSGLTELGYLNDDEHFNDYYSQIYDLYYNLSDINENIFHYFNSFDFSTEKFDEIQEIYFALNKLKRKYGQNITSILKARDEIEEKINHFKHRDDLLEDLKAKMDDYLDQACCIAEKISILRKEYAQKFSQNVTRILKELYLPNVSFEFLFTDTELSKNGKDDVTMMLSTNIGQGLKPLHKIASGGELSRIMLAIKTVCNNFNHVETIIFDEADTGVSGKVAESIGQIMKTIAKKQQVICITHLAQVAGFADHHLLIQKMSNEQDTHVTIQQLNDEESVNELAKMISGKNITEESINHARRLKVK